MTGISSIHCAMLPDSIVQWFQSNLPSSQNRWWIREQYFQWNTCGCSSSGMSEQCFTKRTHYIARMQCICWWHAASVWWKRRTVFFSYSSAVVVIKSETWLFDSDSVLPAVITQSPQPHAVQCTACAGFCQSTTEIGTARRGEIPYVRFISGDVPSAGIWLAHVTDIFPELGSKLFLRLSSVLKMYACLYFHLSNFIHQTMIRIIII